MKKRTVSLGHFALAAALVLALALVPLAGAALADEALVNDGLTLTIPEEYAGLVIAEAPENDEFGYLFTVSEKASVEAGQLQHPGEDWGDGWLFSIGRVDEETLHTLLCGDMFGAHLFAADGESYYLAYYPTDVRIVREDYSILGDPDSEDWQQWSALTEWARTVPETFLEENEGLTPSARGNSDVDVYLSRIAYLEDEHYSLAYLSHGELDPAGTDPLPYVDRLLDGADFTYTEDEAPDGEYVVLNLIDEEVRLDFFLAEGNYVREVYGDGYEILFQGTYADGETVASDIMLEWYDALAAE